MIWGISLILLSIIAVPSLLLSKKPNAKELLDKVAPYQGWIGLVFLFWGLWGIISAVLAIGMLSTAPIWWAVWVLGCVVEAGLGFMLGYGLMSQLFLSKNAEAKAKAEQIRAKLAPKQGKLGILGIIIGIAMIVINLMPSLFL
ncbi:hypothetical protein [Aquimarina algicola]|uniref:DUF2269 family protein n=1 Tax=Aquimarina algicola TaxID=2589995 RepID=A0A504J624_9FLAO|nr:hypothetical protein [Aquimarina algicola]TPN85974.1 hypothetical protein FHK87_11880 [Aquimarina algicola]